MISLPEVPEWFDRARCRHVADPDIFFPSKGGSALDAKAICRACPVLEQCQAYALEHREKFGVWGGLSEHDRRDKRTGVKRVAPTPSDLCGTYKGYCRHRRRGEVACPPCGRSATLYNLGRRRSRQRERERSS